MNSLLSTSSPAVAALQRLYLELSALTNLQPSPTVNKFFNELVTLALTDSDDLARDPEAARIIPALRQLAGTGETALEHHWAERIIAAHDSNAELKQFPYYQNYRELSRFELDVLSDIGGRTPKRVLFIGGGPLPLTGILLAGLSGSPVDVMDIDAQAATAAQVLLVRLGLGDAVHVITADAATHTQYGIYDAVIMAALVGDDTEAKASITRQIIAGLQPGALLAARSATGNRQILYPPVPANTLAGLQPFGEFDPPPGVINSIVVGRKTARHIRTSTVT